MLNLRFDHHFPCQFHGVRWNPYLDHGHSANRHPIRSKRLTVHPSLDSLGAENGHTDPGQH